MPDVIVVPTDVLAAALALAAAGMDLNADALADLVLVDLGADVVCLVRDWVPQSELVRSKTIDKVRDRPNPLTLPRVGATFWGTWPPHRGLIHKIAARHTRFVVKVLSRMA